MTIRDALFRVSDEEMVRRLSDGGETELVALTYEAGRRRLGSALSSLLILLGSSDLDTQLGSLEALGEIGDDRAGQRILSILEDDRVDRSIRDTASWTLGLLRYRPAAAKLAWLLLASEPTVRSCAAAALVAIGDKTVFPAVQFQLAQERDESVRRDLLVAAEHLKPTGHVELEATRSQLSGQFKDQHPNDASSLAAYPQSGNPASLHG